MGRPVVGEDLRVVLHHVATHELNVVHDVVALVGCCSHVDALPVLASLFEKLDLLQVEIIQNSQSCGNEMHMRPLDNRRRIWVADHCGHQLDLL